jgi:hypothetical protein
MKKIFLIFFLIGLSNCSKGELQISTIDFDTASLQYCDAVNIESQLFFKINGQESLILQLAPGLLQNENSEGIIESPIPSASKLTYRIFNNTVSVSYFCDLLTPASPVVIEDLNAEVGRVRIETIQNTDDPQKFDHTITLQGVSFVNSKGERLTNLTVENYGTVTTTLE